MLTSGSWLGGFAAATLLAALNICAATAQERAPAAKLSIQELYTRNPFTVYRARGEDNACGPGCSEWIAVEGVFSPGSAARFSKLLRSLKGRASTVPVFFVSQGGMQAEAMAIGRLLRQHRMTAGVAWTLPAACSAGGSDKACKAAKASGSILKAEWQNINAECNSSCVFALIGATTRLVPPASFIGVHSGVAVCIRPRGQITKGRCAADSAGARDATRPYLREMGVDNGLSDIIAATPFETMRYLTRDEIIRSGIDPRASQEMPWVLIKPPTGTAYIVKTFTEAKGAAGDEVRLSFVRLSCIQGRIFLTYARGLPKGDFGAGMQVAASIASEVRALSRTAHLQRLPPDQSSVDIWSGFLPANFGAVLNVNEIIKIFEIKRWPGEPEQNRIVRISTEGLPALLTILQSQCSVSTPT